MWFWNNQSDDTNPMLVRWLGGSHRIGSSLCYWILSEKVKVLSQTTVQNLTPQEPRDTDVQERIRDYHGSLEDALGSEEFGTSLAMTLCGFGITSQMIPSQCWDNV